MEKERAREQDHASKQEYAFSSAAEELAAKKTAFLKATMRADKLLEARDALNPYAAQVSRSSQELARCRACGCMRAC